MLSYCYESNPINIWMLGQRPPKKPDVGHRRRIDDLPTLFCPKMEHKNSIRTDATSVESYRRRYWPMRCSESHVSDVQIFVPKVGRSFSYTNSPRNKTKFYNNHISCWFKIGGDFSEVNDHKKEILSHIPYSKFTIKVSLLINTGKIGKKKHRRPSKIPKI